jgi:hypothetical protein
MGLSSHPKSRLETTMMETIEAYLVYFFLNRKIIIIEYDGRRNVPVPKKEKKLAILVFFSEIRGLKRVKAALSMIFCFSGIR